MYVCNDFKISQITVNSTSSIYDWPTRRERVRETPDYDPGDNRRHVARGKRVFTGDKFKDSVSATRTWPVPQGIWQTTPAATRSVGAARRV